MSNSEDGKRENEKDAAQSAQDWYNNLTAPIRNLQLREKVAAFRETIDKEVVNNRVVRELREIPEKPQQWRQTVDQNLDRLSNEINTQFPYFAGLCRSHSELIIASAAVFTAIPLWTRFVPRKVFFGFLFTSALSSYAGVQVVNYKWRHEPTPPSDV